MKITAMLSIALIGLFLCQGIASAHAFVDRAEPKVGSDVQAAPKQVRVWFTQELEPAFSGLKVLDAEGNRVDANDSHQDPVNKHLLIVLLPALPSGTYTVVWHVLSIDTHKTRGDFKFTVRP